MNNKGKEYSCFVGSFEDIVGQVEQRVAESHESPLAVLGLLILRFLAGQYEEVIKTAGSAYWGGSISTTADEGSARANALRGVSCTYDEAVRLAEGMSIGSERAFVESALEQYHGIIVEFSSQA